MSTPDEAQAVEAPQWRPAIRRSLARAALLYLFLFAISTVTLGVFVVAFIASLKDDALSNPTELRIHQLNPANWASAARLASQSSGDVWFGGLAPGASVEFTLRYAVAEGREIEEPMIAVPVGRIRLLGADNPARSSGADNSRLVSVGELQEVGRAADVAFTEVSGTKATPRKGSSRSWRLRLTNVSDGDFIEALPLTVTVPKGQVLIDSDLPPFRIERRGRVASWENLSPGVTGYVFGNYVRVVKDARSLSTGRSLFLSWTFNSAFIAILKVLLTLAVACLGGYALARFRFPGSRVVFLLLLLSMMVPGQVLFISNYLIFRDLGLMNTPWAVIAAVVASGQVLIMKQFFESIPREVEEAAIVDGAGPLRVMWSIFLPMSRPAIASVVILGFQGAWNDFFWPLVVLTGPSETFTLPVGLLSLRNAYGVTGDWGLILAGSFLSTIPVLIIFIIFQRYFVENDSSSAVKG